MRVLTWQHSSDLSTLPHALADEASGHGHDWITHLVVPSCPELWRGQTPAYTIPEPPSIMLALAGLAAVALLRRRKR